MPFYGRDSVWCGDAGRHCFAYLPLLWTETPPCVHRVTASLSVMGNDRIFLNNKLMLISHSVPIVSRGFDFPHRVKMVIYCYIKRCAWCFKIFRDMGSKRFNVFQDVFIWNLIKLWYMSIFLLLYSNFSIVAGTYREQFLAFILFRSKGVTTFLSPICPWAHKGSVHTMSLLWIMLLYLTHD